MFIKKLIIRNFRSIVFAEVELTNLNIIVGLNDIGKSNLLKALNLFFNGETESGKKLDFDEDFSLCATLRNKKAKEISVELHINTPSNYSVEGKIKWVKAWRREGEVENSISNLGGNVIPDRSKIYSWLRNLRYRYVPAVKSEIYFQNLLGDLHDTLYSTVSNTLQEAGADFISKIKDNTAQMSISITQRLGFHSDIQLPTNLKELFKTLDFRTTNGHFQISLQKRGDGIKARHIPVILKFLSEQENKNRQKGSPRANTIWGYEEPENNLELLKAYDVAFEFTEYSNEIQILTTTHSPAFYSLINDGNGVEGYLAERTENQKTNYKRIDKESFDKVDEHMGVLPIITPYINIEIAKRKDLDKKILTLQAEIENLNLPTIFVEGKTDKIIFEHLLSIRSFTSKVAIECSSEEGGAVYVHDMIMAWAYSKNKNIAIGLFDKDNAGKKYKDLVDCSEQVENAKAKKKVATHYLDLPVHIKAIRAKNVIVPCSIEEIFGSSIWEYAHNMGWLEHRDTKEIKDFIKIPIPLDKSIVNVLDENGFTDEEKRYILFKVKDSSKVSFADHVGSIAKTKLELPKGFVGLYDSINQYLANANQIFANHVNQPHLLLIN